MLIGFENFPRCFWEVLKVEDRVILFLFLGKVAQFNYYAGVGEYRIVPVLQLNLSFAVELYLQISVSFFNFIWSI